MAPPVTDQESRILLRKGIHLAVGLGALTLVYGSWVALLVTGGLGVFNTWIWPRIGGRRLWYDPGADYDVGILAYPWVLFVLTLLFHRRLEIVAAVWAILAVGDGMAAIAGRRFGHRSLPWNPDKTWTGTWVYWIFGSVGAIALLHRMEVWSTQGAVAEPAPGRFSFLIGVAVLATGFSAAVESLPLKLDDNLTAPPLTALLLWGLLESEAWWTNVDLGTTVVDFALCWVVGSLLSAVAYAARSVDLSGALAGALLAASILTFLGFAGLCILGAFFVLGSVATRWGKRRKVTLGVAQAAAGRRSARNALANGGVPAILAVFAVTTGAAEALSIAFVAALAAATSDTLSSEIGQVWGGRPLLITTLRRVPQGSDGGLTWIGSLAGLLGGLLIATLGVAVGLVPAAAWIWVVFASVVGNLLDSLLGATLERRGWLDNEAVNFAATLGAALVGLAWALH